MLYLTVLHVKNDPKNKIIIIIIKKAPKSLNCMNLSDFELFLWAGVSPESDQQEDGLVADDLLIYSLIHFSTVIHKNHKSRNSRGIKLANENPLSNFYLSTRG